MGRGREGFLGKVSERGSLDQQPEHHLGMCWDGCSQALPQTCRVHVHTDQGALLLLEFENHCLGGGQGSPGEA